jgi:TonB-linked SusC/RagA family outer membrane protein
MRKLLFLLAAICLAQVSYAQTKVSGTITDEKKEPLQFVSVQVKGSNTGTVTDAKGNFTITAASNATLEISLTGYAPQQIKVNGRTTVAISLEQTTSTLEEAVVIGYQKVTRKKNTAAISSISGKELANLPAASFDQLLQGRLSGVNVQNFSGQPGATPSVIVRGATNLSTSYDETRIVNQPLYVVDGVPQPTDNYVGAGTGTGANYLGGINPNDIESIDVLKDASSAAIYGSRAANGVILITTKKGRSGAPKVVVSGFGGVTERPKLRDVTLGAAERRQKMEILQRQLLYQDQRNLPRMLTDSLNPAFNGNTDWQDMFYQRGVIKSGDVSLSGGGDGGMNYRFSTNYYDEQGIIKATGYKRYSTRLNLFSKGLRGKLDINPIIAFSRSDNARGNGSGNSPISLGASNMPSSLFALDPNKKEFILGAYDDNMDKNINNQFTFILNLGYSFTPKFRFSSQSSYILSTSRRDYNRTNELENNNGNYSYTYSDNRGSVLSSNFLSYTTTVASDHSVSALLGTDVQFDEFQNTQASGWNGASDQIQVVQGFQQNKISAYSDYQAYGLLSFYARLAYDYKSKYLVSLSTRYDGSSRFGKNNKWGFFPAASAAWILSEENFLKNSAFSLVKLRASVGTSGALPTSNYLQYNLYDVNAGGFNGNGGSTSYNGQTSITPNFVNGAAQKGLSWEKSMQWNVGADLEYQNGRYSASLEFYNKENSFQFTDVYLPVTSGYDLATTNSIGVRNAGVELSLAAYPLSQQSAIKWFTRINIAYNKNTIMALPNGGRDYTYTSGDRFDKSHIMSVGSPINAFYLYRTLGVFSSIDDIPANPYTGERYRNSNGTYNAGDFYFADLDGDYNIDIFNDGINPDKVPYGDPNPKFTGGWTNNFNWKNLSLGLFFTYTFDRDILNNFEADQFSNSTDGDAVGRFARFSTPDFDKINIWRATGDQATYAKYDIGTYRYYYTSAQTFFIEPGDYVRLKSVNVGYDLSPRLLKKWKVDRFRVFGVVDNVLRWQASDKLIDAENVNTYGEYNGAGYPIPKKFTLGFEVQF